METVLDGSYQPLSRPIFIYVNAKSLEQPEVKEFVEYYMKNAPKLASEVKYVPLPAKAYTIATGARRQEQEAARCSAASRGRRHHRRAAEREAKL